jgi:hypothetical protein
MHPPPRVAGLVTQAETPTAEAALASLVAACHETAALAPLVAACHVPVVTTQASSYDRHASSSSYDMHASSVCTLMANLAPHVTCRAEN